jgi:hypothetical protein
MSGDTSDTADGSNSLSPPFPYGALHEINERCIELLINEARADRRPPVPLVVPLRDILLHTTTEARRRAAQRGLLLVDMRFQDRNFWYAVQREPGRSRSLPSAGSGSFPRRSAVPLARSILVLAWHSLRADREAARILLGLSASVATVLEKLALSDIDAIAGAQFRHVQPRWPDKAAVWRELLTSAQSDRAVSLARFNVHALQLMTGSQLFQGDASPGVQRARPARPQQTGPAPDEARRVKASISPPRRKLPDVSDAEVGTNSRQQR